MEKIILAFDSFKGCLSSHEITSVAKKSINESFPNCEVACFPIADGGEGTSMILSSYLGATTRTINVHGPLGAIIEATYYLKDKMAIIEVASASGLTLIDPAQRSALYSSTFGTGELVLDALNQGCRNFIIGLGGSATNDAATGMLSALGYRFLDANNVQVNPIGNSLSFIERIDDSKADCRLHDCHFTLACDVTNPFYGPNGAAFVYAPQNGASSDQVTHLDQGLKMFAKVIRQYNGVGVDYLSGAGAAGGMGGTLYALLNSEIQSGIDTVLNVMNFNESLEDADLILTGEGKIDIQTGMGKALDGVLKRGLSKGVPVIAIAGCVENVKELNDIGFRAIFSIQSGPISLTDAMKRDVARNNIYHTVSQIVRVFDSSRK